MNDRMKRLFGNDKAQTEIESLGEDMAPSPHALAERSALSAENLEPSVKSSSSPFVTAAQAPIRG